MKVFNSLQLTGAFVAWPFLISWLADAQFRGAGVAFYAACAAYVIAFGAMTFCVHEQMEK